MGWETAEKIKKFIEENTEYKAESVVPNGQYRDCLKSIIQDGVAFPYFSLRYGAVAPDLGHIEDKKSIRSLRKKK